MNRLRKNDVTPWEDIAEELGVSVSEVQRIYKNAIRKVERLIENDAELRGRLLDLLEQVEASRASGLDEDLQIALLDMS
jgi:hypothetical protein